MQSMLPGSVRFPNCIDGETRVTGIFILRKGSASNVNRFSTFVSYFQDNKVFKS